LINTAIKYAHHERSGLAPVIHDGLECRSLLILA
jgi:hypothetical protein